MSTRTTPSGRRGEPTFRLQVPIAELPDYAKRYTDIDDKVLAFGAAARARGFYTREEFLLVCEWKTQRSKRLTALNSLEEVESATRIALEPDASERQRMSALCGLSGVDVRTASVFLHLDD